MKKTCFDCKYCWQKMTGEAFCGCSKEHRVIEDYTRETDCKHYTNEQYEIIKKQNDEMLSTYDSLLDHIADLYDCVGQMREQFVTKLENESTTSEKECVNERNRVDTIDIDALRETFFQALGQDI